MLILLGSLQAVKALFCNPLVSRLVPLVVACPAYLLINGWEGTLL